MKTAFLALFFFLFASFAAADTDTVLDTDGEPVINNGGPYRILPAIRGTSGGGLTLVRAGNETCSSTVVQASTEFNTGLPTRISTQRKTRIIRSGWSVDIQFTTAPTCTPKPLLWRVPPDSGSVKIGEDKRFRGEFIIEKASEDGYKLEHCPSSPFSCRDLGIFVDEEGNRRLARVGQNPFIFKFEKANKNSEKCDIV